MINRSGRILSCYRDETGAEGDPLHPCLHVRPLEATDLIADAFWAISRDGAAQAEVQMRRQKVLTGLMAHPDLGLCDAACTAAEDYLARALDTITWEADRAMLEAAVKTRSKAS